MGRCNRCDETVEDVALIDHIRVMHPDDYGDGPERWPDGQIVVIDTEPSMDDLEADDA